MKAVSPWLLCFFVWTIPMGICVRIFENILPKALPTRNIPFEPKVLSETCKLKPEKGPCRAGIQMYYFNVTTNECANFSWGGCQGNGNRFDTIDECNNKCLSKVGTRRQAPKYCALTYDYGYCFGALQRWYFDNIWKTCKQTIYSGCGGNDNNFLYREQCESICLFRKGPIVVKTTTVDGPRKIIIINPPGSGNQAQPRADSSKTVKPLIPYKNNTTSPGYISVSDPNINILN